jgi:hypothetical protein
MSGLCEFVTVSHKVAPQAPEPATSAAAHTSTARIVFVDRMCRRNRPGAAMVFLEQLEQPPPGNFEKGELMERIIVPFF